jgi:hypothetical protein
MVPPSLPRIKTATRSLCAQDPVYIASSASAPAPTFVPPVLFRAAHSDFEHKLGHLIEVRLQRSVLGALVLDRLLALPLLQCEPRPGNGEYDWDG